MSNVLVIGGTGNMGRPLVKYLLAGGCSVSVVCRRKVGDDDEKDLARSGGKYLYGDAKNMKFMREVLNRYFDAIVDFCIYSSDEFHDRMDMFLDKTDQHVCLSTAAVYADIPTPKTESSPRYMEVDPPKEGTVKWGWYCYEKARIEDMLIASDRHNWTIVRPGVTMNADHVGWGLWWNDDWCGRILRGRKVVVEKDILDFKFSLSSGAQVALLIVSVIGNRKAFGEIFNVCSEEVWSWRNLLDLHRLIFQKNGYDLKLAFVNSQDVIRMGLGSEYSYARARLLDRVFDNSKIQSIGPGIADGLQGCQKSMTELLEEWIVCYIRQYKSIHTLGGNNLWKTAQLDRLSGDHSSRRDFYSFRQCLKYLIIRYFPVITRFQSCTKRRVKNLFASR